MSTPLSRVAYACAAMLMVVVASACGRSAPQRVVEAQSPAPAAQTPRPERADPTTGWSDERIREFWQQVEAGPSLKPASWPGGATVAVALSFDFQMGTVYEPSPAASTNTNSQYDGRVGLPRLLKMLDAQRVPASFFVTGVTAAFYPAVIQQIMASGRHEIGVHGWIHENNTSVSADEERRLLTKAIAALEKATGKGPVGYRSPSWAFSAATLDLLRANNFLYDSGMMADDEPYEILVGGKRTGLLEIPVEWMRDDAMYYPRSNPHSPDAVFEVLRAEFDKAYEEHGLFQVTMHPRISGHRSRVVMLEKFITYMKGRPGVWFATHEQVARHVKPAK
jgi:peptidoglycan/xylan/chitin deacetylase (PgdA/CDA1 family)